MKKYLKKFGVVSMLAVLMSAFFLPTVRAFTLSELLIVILGRTIAAQAQEISKVYTSVQSEHYNPALKDGVVGYIVSHRASVDGSSVMAKEAEMDKMSK